MEGSTEMETENKAQSDGGSVLLGATNKEERVAFKIMIGQFISEHGKQDSTGFIYVKPEDVEVFLGPKQFLEFQESMAGRTVYALPGGIGICPDNLFDFANRN